MTASDSLHSDWTTSVFSSSLSSTVTDLVLIHESLTSSTNDLRITKDEWRMKNEESLRSSLHGRLYNLR
jgi:hypothetical protein